MPHIFCHCGKIARPDGEIVINQNGETLKGWGNEQE